MAEGRALAVYAFRDVRDVVFSLMHKRGLTFEQLLRQGMIHQVLANDRFWMRQPNVLVQRYEEILSDPVGGVRTLADHLKIDLEDGEAEHIANEYSLESNKARTEALRRRLEQVGVDLNEAANAQICDSTTLLHWNHVRSGGSGSWYAEATPRQRLILASTLRTLAERAELPAHPRRFGFRSCPGHIHQPAGSFPDRGRSPRRLAESPGPDGLATVPTAGPRRQARCSGFRRRPGRRDRLLRLKARVARSVIDEVIVDKSRSIITTITGRSSPSTGRRRPWPIAWSTGVPSRPAETRMIGWEAASISGNTLRSRHGGGRGRSRRIQSRPSWGR